jgi:hypothetical protein
MPDAGYRYSTLDRKKLSLPLLDSDSSSASQSIVSRKPNIMRSEDTALESAPNLAGVLYAGMAFLIWGISPTGRR